MPSRYSYAEYVALESVSTAKHEYLDGYIYAMPLVSEDHSVLASAMVRVLGNAACDFPCSVHTGDLRIYVESVGLATYADVSVVCGSLQQHGSGHATALNPSILVEVTTDASEYYDTGPKLEYYQTIPTLREYVIVSHRERRITVHSRGAAGAWTVRVAGRGERVGLPSLDAELVVDEIYLNSAVA